jgi:hypothetical protein
MRRLELGTYVLLGAVIAAGLALTIVHAGREVYAIPGYGIAIAAGAALIAAAGIALAWRARQGRVVALAAVAGALAVLALLSFVPLLVLVAVIAALAVRSARGEGNAAAALAGGAMLGLGLHVVALIALSPALVDCGDGSVGENVFLGLGSHAVSGTGSAGADGSSRGRIHGETYDLSFACRGGELVEFDLRDR